MVLYQHDMFPFYQNLIQKIPKIPSQQIAHHQVPGESERTLLTYIIRCISSMKICQVKKKYRGMFEIQHPETWLVSERLISTLKHMHVPYGTWPAVQRSKVHLLAWYTYCKILWKPLDILLNRTNSIIRSRSVKKKQRVGVISDQWRMSRYMIMLLTIITRQIK